jgi:DNA helicase IV
MRVLIDVRPTPEQLSIVSRNKPGIEVIRGAAGSGKTTTALLRLRSLIGAFINRRRRQEGSVPVRALVLTYNRTLRGYIEALAQQQVSETSEVNLVISTFAKWAKSSLGNPRMVPIPTRRKKIMTLGSGLGLQDDFLLEEVEYVLGRFLPDKLDDYLNSRRDGRGISPRVDRKLRESILNKVLRPYQSWIDDKDLWDWNDLAVKLAYDKLDPPYDIIITDETQDFSANQIRAIKNQLAKTHSLTLVIDTAQRIYARGFTWQETGINVRPENSRRLVRNYRNTIEIAKFAMPLIEGIPIDDDATIPDFSQCENHGRKPIVLSGKFSGQMKFVVRYLRKEVNLNNESVAFLHPLGGGWFNFTKNAIDKAGFDYVELTRKSEWPQGIENIAFSTLYSAKGLEFDHVIIVGLNAEVMSHGENEDDDRLIKLRRLLAMGIGRARKSVILGYKPEDMSQLIKYLKRATFEKVNV